MMEWLHCYRRAAHAPLYGRIILFFSTFLLLWAPWAGCIYGLGWLWGKPELASSVALGVLYSCFICCAWFWGRWIHGWQRPFEAYGLITCVRFLGDAAVAWVCSIGLVCGLFGIEVLLGWANFHPRSLMPIVLEGVIVGLAIGVAEEILFRGWLLAELKTSLSRSQAIGISSLIFAAAHFIKPLSDVISTSPQFLGLLILGLILGVMRYTSRLGGQFMSLGLPIGLHAGLVGGYYIVDVGDLAVPSGRVPEWVTGIHGNPLSGALGVTILGGLALLVCLRLRSG